MKNGIDNMRLRLAAFVAQALELEGDPSDLAAELVALKEDVAAGIWTVELESTVGPAAFLVYHYLLEQRDEQGRTGRTLFDADLATLEQASARESPGPRILAHALAGTEAFILATTPATFRALTGENTADDAEAASADLLTSANADDARSESAAELLRLLQLTDREARRWLAAIRAAGHAKMDDPEAEHAIEFIAEETALALFLLDNRSIQHLLQVLNLVIESARHQAAEALDRERQP